MSKSNGQNGRTAGPLKSTSNGIALTRPEVQPEKKRAQSPLHDENGDFAKGNPGGPGRPRGSLDFMTIARELAKKTGEPVEDAVETCLSSLKELAAEKDVPAIKTLLDRLCGPQEKGPTVNVGVDARTAIAVGPPVPEGKDFGEYIRKLTSVAADQGLLGDDSPEELVATAIQTAAEKAAELKELLG